MKEFFKPSIAKIALMLLIPLYLAVEVGVEKVGFTATSVDLTYGLLLFPLPYVVVFFSAFAIIGSTSIDTSTWQWANFSIWQKGWGIFLEFIVPLIISYKSGKKKRDQEY